MLTLNPARATSLISNTLIIFVILKAGLNPSQNVSFFTNTVLVLIFLIILNLIASFFISISNNNNFQSKIIVFLYLMLLIAPLLLIKQYVVLTAFIINIFSMLSTNNKKADAWPKLLGLYFLSLLIAVALAPLLKGLLDVPADLLVLDDWLLIHYFWVLFYFVFMLIFDLLYLARKTKSSFISK
jgi:hypothetical protein